MNTEHYDGELRTHFDKCSKNGTTWGLKDEPKFNSDFPDERESGIQLLARKPISDEQVLFNRKVKSYQDNVSIIEKRIASTEAIIPSLLITPNLKGEVNVLISDSLSGQAKLIHTKKMWQRALHRFQLENEIHTPPVAPGNFLYGIGVILIFACLEIVLNALFFQDAEGLPKAIGIAAGLSVISMGTSAVLGNFWRYKNLSKINHKLIGWGAFGAFVFLVIFTNAVFSKFRTLFEKSDGNLDTFWDAFTQSLGIFYGQYSFDDLMSYILFGVGIFLMCLAFYKGYTIFSMYPGYWVVAEKLTLAEEAEKQHAQQLKDKVSRLYGEKIQDLKEAMDLPISVSKLLTENEVSISHSFRRYKTSIENIQKDYSSLIKQYRLANSSVAGRSQVPAYFQDEIAILYNAIEYDALISDLLEGKKILMSRVGKIASNFDQLNAEATALRAELVEILSINVPKFLKDADCEADIISQSRKLV